MQHGHRHEDLVAALDAERHEYAEGTLPYVHPGGTVRIIDGDAPATWFSQDPGVANAVTAGPPSWEPVRVPARNVIAVYRFSGGPGRETEAAEAWAFEITYFFLRGVGEQPIVAYADRVYTVSGLMTTTYPYDRAPETVLGPSTPPGLDWVGNPDRRRLLREIYASREHWRFDGRDGGGE